MAHQTSIPNKNEDRKKIHHISGLVRTFEFACDGKGVVDPLHYGKQHIYTDTHSTRVHTIALLLYLLLLLLQRVLACVLFVNLFSFELHGKKN